MNIAASPLSCPLYVIISLYRPALLHYGSTLSIKIRPKHRYTAEQKLTVWREWREMFFSKTLFLHAATISSHISCMEKYNLSPLKIEKISLHFWMNWAILHTLKKDMYFDLCYPPPWVHTIFFSRLYSSLITSNPNQERWNNLPGSTSLRHFALVL